MSAANTYIYAAMQIACGLFNVRNTADKENEHRERQLQLYRLLIPVQGVFRQLATGQFGFQLADFALEVRPLVLHASYLRDGSLDQIALPIRRFRHRVHFLP